MAAIILEKDINDDEMIECCLNCGSAGVVHFDEGDGPEMTFHRCMRCLGEYTGCNFGSQNLDPRTRLTGLQTTR